MSAAMASVVAANDQRPAVPLLEVRDLSVAFGRVRAVRGVGFAVPRGGAFGLVGESGSGKSTVLRALAGLNPNWAGEILLDGRPVAPVRDRAFHRRVQMVFQDPYGSLHPRQTVLRQLREPVAIHRLPDGEARIARALDQVGLPAAMRFRYPHQLSGGQRQRVAIARALILEPELLLLDEPTSALDVSVQAEILNLLMALRRDAGLTFVLVSHDLAVVATLCERLAVMQDGRILEQLSAADLRARRTATEYAAKLLAAAGG
ncbi:ABC transporter ATP-binding protein [Roseomonas sp. BN140053]|uniref:ABC transporter ATP-binding protein n=1 Tax=Roseomonas sp. BN140053 TaxID=3391898 RepID=UPI0039EA80EB